MRLIPPKRSELSYSCSDYIVGAEKGPTSGAEKTIFQFGEDKKYPEDPLSLPKWRNTNNTILNERNYFSVSFSIAKYRCLFVSVEDSVVSKRG